MVRKFHVKMIQRQSKQIDYSDNKTIRHKLVQIELEIRGRTSSGWSSMSSSGMSGSDMKLGTFTSPAELLRPEPEFGRSDMWTSSNVWIP